jgi:hypothetical protein
MLSPKDPAEIVTVTFDFSALTTSVSAPSVTCVYSSGVSDSNPTAVLSGVPQIIGTKVLQAVQLGQDATHYELRCTVTAADGSKYVLADVLPVNIA